MSSLTKVNICGPWICTPCISAWILFGVILGKPSSIQDSEAQEKNPTVFLLKQTDKYGLFSVTMRQTSHLFAYVELTMKLKGCYISRYAAKMKQSVPL